MRLHTWHVDNCGCSNVGKEGKSTAKDEGHGSFLGDDVDVGNDKVDSLRLVVDTIDLHQQVSLEGLADGHREVLTRLVPGIKPAHPDAFESADFTSSVEGHEALIRVGVAVLHVVLVIPIAELFVARLPAVHTAPSVSGRIALAVVVHVHSKDILLEAGVCRVGIVNRWGPRHDALHLISFCGTPVLRVDLLREAATVPL